MGDSGEGLIDAEARIQERLDEVAEARGRRHEPDTRDPVQVRTLESLRLARTDLERQLAGTTHERRKALIAQALAEVDRQIADASGRLNTDPSN
jgi:hypothetical protein